VRKFQERGPRSRFVPANATTKGAFWERDVVAERRGEGAIHQRRIAEERQRD
jgi:hypothetical protein